LQDDFDATITDKSLQNFFKNYLFKKGKNRDEFMLGGNTVVLTPVVVTLLVTPLINNTIKNTIKK